jgi:hypothetical protein
MSKVNTIDGEITAIDFGISFGSGIDLLIPELMPFRLTRFNYLYKVIEFLKQLLYQLVVEAFLDRAWFMHLMLLKLIKELF